MKKAMYFNKIEDGKVHCFLCPHNCVIRPEALGACRARKNIGGELYSLNYGKLTAAAMDPIEKKPLYHFYPGSHVLSVGTFGCNLKCSFCQNWQIAHEASDTDDAADATPDWLVDKALEYMDRGNIGIAYTYNEPSIWYEFVLETCRKAKAKGLRNILVTNGFIGKAPLEELLPYVDAMNIDVKAFTADFYRDICKASLEHVKETVLLAAGKCHVELTTLVIPDLNDSMEEISELSRWIASISPEIPLHLSRYFPNYKLLDKPPTPKETLMKAKEEARKHLTYVYVGNVW